MADDDFSDPDVNLLVALAGALRENYSDDDSSWEGSPFAWIRRRPPRSIGAISENIVAEFFAARGFDVTRSSDTDSDRIINGLRTEIKFSSLWESGTYTFQQIRDQNYDVLVCLGVSPFNAHCGFCPSQR